MSNFHDKFMSLPSSERMRIASEAGLSLGYIYKQTYVRQGAPKFRISNAVALDKASGGGLSFLEHAEEGVDWQYVLERLKAAKRMGKL